MTIRKGNKMLQVILTPYHTKKLAIIVNRTGLSKTGVVQRLIENALVFADEIDILSKEKNDEQIA